MGNILDADTAVVPDNAPGDGTLVHDAAPGDAPSHGDVAGLRLGARDGDGGDRSGAPAATGPNAEAPG